MILNAQVFAETVSEHSPGQNFLLALSGGLDSQVLLHLLQQFVTTHSQYALRVVHINHNVSPEAASWVGFCRQQCAALSVPFINKTITVNLTADARGFEAAARAERYALLAEIAGENEVLVSAHHADDQAETMMLQWLRGAGVKGLAAMPMVQLWQQGYFFRPLLNFTRDELLHFAQDNKVIWVEDHSNDDSRYARNYLRHLIIPEIKKRWPAFVETTARSARHCAQANILLDELAEMDFQLIDTEKTGVFLLDKLKSLSYARQCNVLRYVISSLGFLLPSEKKLQTIINDVVCSKDDAQPCVSWQGVDVRRHQNHLYIMNSTDKEYFSDVFCWDGLDDWHYPRAEITVEKKVVAEILQKKDLSTLELSIGFRKGGERLQSATQTHSLSLKKCFQDWLVPVWLRSLIPLVYCEEKIIYIPGFWRSDFGVIQKNRKVTNN